ncbi:INO80 complex subunit E [Acipenser ruthenus]|uniref:INO80 complex subunit E n=1 Tax=Acipenser ruthenus TaxID=7906 RepID=A0A444UTF2_ACIRT|nr:INO80 complex subunit E [Acipenser ruthenus]
MSGINSMSRIILFLIIYSISNNTVTLNTILGHWLNLGLRRQLNIQFLNLLVNRRKSSPHLPGTPSPSSNTLSLLPRGGYNPLQTGTSAPYLNTTMNGQPEIEADYKKKYKNLKRKLKFLVYEQECFQEELRRAQRKLLKVSRDKSFLLDRLLQYEHVDDDSSGTSSPKAEVHAITKKVHQGENVTLQCDVRHGQETSWCRQHPEQVPVVIFQDALNIRSSEPDPEYHDGFGPRFSSVLNRTTWTVNLKIENISEWDFALYFCTVRVKGDIRFGNSTHLVSAVFIVNVFNLQATLRQEGLLNQYKRNRSAALQSSAALTDEGELARPLGKLQAPRPDTKPLSKEPLSSVLDHLQALSEAVIRDKDSSSEEERKKSD